MGQFVAKVLGSTEDVWTGVFKQSGREYRPPTLVLYDAQVRSGCGMRAIGDGPVLLPRTTRSYTSTSRSSASCKARFRAPGDFAQAYVIAHEVGHHVQKLTGGFDQMESSRGRVSNQASVRLELQADCYAASGDTTPAR